MKQPARILDNFPLLLTFALLAWTAVVAALMAFHYHDSRREMVGIAQSQAAESIKKDLIYRFWAASHGGVYVPVTAKTPPNPYLSPIKDRDLTTASGNKLTLINPAYMTRQVHQLAAEKYKDKAHITSTQPLNPVNAPDTWEAKALTALAQGAGEYGEVVADGTGELYRLMRPLFADEPCLRCHAQQGYQLGDLRGGISATIALAPLKELMLDQVGSDSRRIGALWLLGTGAIFAGAGHLRRRGRERQQAVAELAKSERKFRNLFDSMEEGFALHEIICDEQGRPVDYRYIDVNAAFSRLTGIEKEKLIGRRVMEVLPATETCWIDTFGRVALTGKPAVLEEFSAGIGRWYRVVAYCPTPGQFAVLFTDVTDNRRLEEQLRHAQKMEAIGLLAGGIAHDFNNLLQVITTYGHLIQIQCKESGLPVTFVDEQMAAARRAVNLTGALLTFSRKQTLNPKPVDLNKVLRESRKLLKRIINEDIIFEMEQAPDDLVVWADDGEILQVLMNLATNGRDAMPRGGKLKIITAKTRPDVNLLASHGCEPSGEWALVTVSDTGNGVAPEDLAFIFEPFFTTKEPGKGTGLGLAIIYGIVNRLGGFIEVDSAQGEGTTFRLYFPLLPCQEGLDPIEHAADLSCGTGTILLVEDDAAVRRALTTIMVGHGYTVLEATDGEEGVRVFRENADEIDLALIDMIMPKKNGWKALQEMRSIRPEVRSIFLSGYTGDILKRGCDGDTGVVVRKPVEPGVLLEAIRSILAEERSPAQPAQG